MRGEYYEAGTGWYNLVLDRDKPATHGAKDDTQIHTGECDHPCNQPWDISKQMNIMGIIALLASPGFGAGTGWGGTAHNRITGIKLISFTDFSALPQFQSLLTVPHHHLLME